MKPNWNNIHYTKAVEHAQKALKAKKLWQLRSEAADVLHRTSMLHILVAQGNSSEGISGALTCVEARIMNALIATTLDRAKECTLAALVLLGDLQDGVTVSSIIGGPCTEPFWQEAK